MRLVAENKLLHAILIGLAGAILAFIPYLMDYLDSWEEDTWDWRAKLMMKPGKATDDIALILLDPKSLEWGRQESGVHWPWPREMYGAVVDFCRRSGVKALAFDVLFEDPSGYGVEDDRNFGQAMATFGRVAASVSFDDQEGPGRHWPGDIPLPEFKVIGLKKWLQQADREHNLILRAAMPIVEVAQNAAILCNVTQNPDPDGIYRRIELFRLFDGHLIPSLGLGNYLAAHPRAAMQILAEHMILDGKSIPIDRNARALLRYRGPPGTFKSYSAAAVIQSELQIRNGQPSNINGTVAFKDKYVFFGFSAKGLYDLRVTPVADRFPGAEIYATMLDNFLSSDFMQTVPRGLSIGLIFFFAMACALSATFFNKPAGSLSVSALAILLPVLMCLSAYRLGYWLPLVVLETAGITTIGLALVINYATEGRRRRFIKKAFQHFLSPEVIEQIIAHPERLKLGGERKVLTIFFSDLQGFTSISEGMDPAALTAMLNDYLTAMTDIIHSEGGTIDKYEGDAIIAFWNAPLEIDAHADRAVRAALSCQARLEQLQPTFIKRIGEPLRMRIGINTGPAVVGNMGSHARFDYTVVGDAVNSASRLEGANKQFGTSILISQSTKESLGNQLMTRELARLAVLGRAEPITVHEPMLMEAYESRKEILGAFSQGLSFYYQGELKRALAVFKSIQNSDAAAAAYAARCRTLLDSELKNWQGLWVMDSK
ncbi:MAG: adenylate/guanylate cyclase domain-containing protein [Desulfobacterales bacterium]|jgi:adenylate cyclase